MFSGILKKNAYSGLKKRIAEKKYVSVFPFFCNNVLRLATFFILLVMVCVKGNTGLANIIYELSKHECIAAFILTLKTSVSVVIISAVIGLPMACSLAFGNFRGKIIADTLCDLPLVLPPLVSGIAILALFNPETLTGSLLQTTGVNIIFTPAGIVLAQTFVSLPLFVRTASESMRTVSKELLIAGKLLGGTHFYILLHIVLPISVKGILAGLLMTWARALGEFGATAMVAGCVPQYTETMPVAIYVNILGGNSEAASALATVLMFTALLIMGVTRFLLRPNQYA